MALFAMVGILHIHHFRAFRRKRFAMSHFSFQADFGDVVEIYR